ncbi:HEAT repeat domain-containing protein (plasmid) [Sorangium sp. So ce119]|uniref:HEAT repeat domain-containing protein n=1 Tax=Sorangium sp. So ce119 TaxID=3133279 RepID=UPI003F632B2D
MSRAFDDLGPYGDPRVSDAGAWPTEPESISPSVRSTPMPISAIAAALAADDAEERRQAAARLGRADVAEALPLLLRALGDPDWRVRKEATYACHRLIQQTSPSAAAAEGERPAAAQGGAEGDRPPAAQGAEAERPSASQLLVGALLDALRTSDDVGLRNAAIEVLGYCGRDATPALVGALGELAGDERKLVVDALGRTRDPAALDALYATLGEKDDNLRQSAIEAISGMGLIARERVTDILYERLADRDRFVRLTSLNGLNGLEAPVPWRVLAPLIDDPILRSSALVAAALAESPEAPRALCAALATARGGAFAQLVRALARLAEGPLASHVVTSLRAAPLEVGARLVQAAAAQGSGGAEPPSWRGLGADPVSGRAQALVLAAMARAPGAADAAVQAMIEPALVETAQRALGLLGEEALPAVLAYLERHVDPDPDLWEGLDDATAALIDGAVAIAEQRGRGGDPARPAPDAAADPPLDELLGAVRRSVKSPSTLVATSALYGLAKIGTADDFELVVSQTRAISLPVARAAESALAGLSERYPEAARALARQLMQAERTHLAAAIVIEALGSADPEELAFLRSAASAGDVRARRAAVTAVAAAAGVAALDVLSFSLADEEREVRLAAARALGRLYASLSDAGPAGGERARARELLGLVRASGEPELVAAAAQGGAPFRSDPPWGEAGDRLSAPVSIEVGEGAVSTPGMSGGPPSGKVP